MTFLEEVKAELCNVRVRGTCCMAAELRAMLLFGAVEFSKNAIFGTENFEIAKRMSSFLKHVCNINYTEKLDENAGSYKFLIPQDILTEIGIQAQDGILNVSDKKLDDCCKHAFVRGAFMVSGSVSNPEKSYRMEIFSENESAIDTVFDILTQIGIDVKKTQRKNLFVVYTNKSESVSDMLKVTEASMAVFTVLEAKVIKDKRNETNRVINCDMANADRASENSYRETVAIRRIENKIGLDQLNQKLRSVALMRLENEGASLKELAAMFDPPLPKSTLNNRLNKLIKMAEELGE